MELHLDRKLAERRIFPAIDIRRSGTRREEMLLSKEELDAVWHVRKNMNDSFDFIEGFLKKMKNAKNNAEFIAALDATEEKGSTKPSSASSSKSNGNSSSGVTRRPARTASAPVTTK